MSKIVQKAGSRPSTLANYLDLGSACPQVMLKNGFGSYMTFTSDADEVFYYLHGLDQKSDILNLLPMAAYVVRADGVVIWYNARAAELWGRKPAIGDTDERFCGAHTLYHADGSESLRSNSSAASTR